MINGAATAIDDVPLPASPQIPGIRPTTTGLCCFPWSGFSWFDRSSRIRISLARAFMLRNWRYNNELREEKMLGFFTIFFFIKCEFSNV
jgi:hypothetical protein